MFVFCVDDLRPSQHFLCHFGTLSCLPLLNQYLAEDKVSFSRTQYSAFDESSDVSIYGACVGLDVFSPQRISHRAVPEF